MLVRKAVIPVAGFGTRFLPITKAIPKPMIPVLDKPIVHYVVDAAIRSGIKQIILVTGSNCQSIEDYFDRNWKLEAELQRSGKVDLLEEIRQISRMAEIAYVRQTEQLGNGHAVLMARHVIGDEPFAVLWGDDILLGDPPVPRQLIDTAEKYGGPVVGVRQVPPEEYERYGMVAVESIPGEPAESTTKRAVSVVEKPRREDSPSNLAQIGGFILTPDIFDLLAATPVGPHGEIFLADAFTHLMAQRAVYTCAFSGVRYDAGNKLDYMRASVELALSDPQLGPPFRQFLRELDARNTSER